jgi:hypothetical protein
VPAVHLDIGGVEIDRRRCGQPGAARHRQMVQHPVGNPSHPDLHICPLWTRKLARQARGGGRAQSRYRCDRLSRHIGALPVQADQDAF